MSSNLDLGFQSSRCQVPNGPALVHCPPIDRFFNLGQRHIAIAGYAQVGVFDVDQWARRTRREQQYRHRKRSKSCPTMHTEFSDLVRWKTKSLRHCPSSWLPRSMGSLGGIVYPTLYLAQCLQFILWVSPLQKLAYLRTLPIGQDHRRFPSVSNGYDLSRALGLYYTVLKLVEFLLGSSCPYKSRCFRPINHTTNTVGLSRLQGTFRGNKIRFACRSKPAVTCLHTTRQCDQRDEHQHFGQFGAMHYFTVPNCSTIAE